MRNKVVKKLLMIAMAVTMISGTSLATVYANANPPAEETTTAVVEETTTEKSKDTEKAEDTGRVTGESNNSAFSGAFSNISPIVVSLFISIAYILLFYFINFGIFLILSYFFKKV